MRKVEVSKLDLPSVAAAAVLIRSPGLTVLRVLAYYFSAQRFLVYLAVVVLGLSI